MAVPFGLGPITFMTLAVITITLLITIVQKYTVDQNVMRELKADSKKMRKELKAIKNDPAKRIAGSHGSHHVYQFIQKTKNSNETSNLYHQNGNEI